MRVISTPQRLFDNNRRAFRAAVLEVQGEMMAHAPVRTGDMRRRVTVEWLSDLRARVGLRHPGARIREFGGTIVARRARYLRFKTRDGHWVQVRQVTQRPGGYSQGHVPWIRPAGRRFGEFLAKHLRGAR